MRAINSGAHKLFHFSEKSWKLIFFIMSYPLDHCAMGVFTRTTFALFTEIRSRYLAIFSWVNDLHDFELVFLTWHESNWLIFFQFKSRLRFCKEKSIVFRYNLASYFNGTRTKLPMYTHRFSILQYIVSKDISMVYISSLK